MKTKTFRSLRALGNFISVSIIFVTIAFCIFLFSKSWLLRIESIAMMNRVITIGAASFVLCFFGCALCFFASYSLNIAYKSFMFLSLVFNFVFLIVSVSLTIYMWTDKGYTSTFGSEISPGATYNPDLRSLISANYPGKTVFDASNDVMDEIKDLTFWVFCYSLLLTSCIFLLSSILIFSRCVKIRIDDSVKMPVVEFTKAGLNTSSLRTTRVVHA